jgi:hypothetical protein
MQGHTIKFPQNLNFSSQKERRRRKGYENMNLKVKVNNKNEIMNSKKGAKQFELEGGEVKMRNYSSCKKTINI